MSGKQISPEQAQTENTFGFKWSRSDTYSSEAVRAEWRRWLLEKYFDGDLEGPARLLDSTVPLRILDAGCGAGVSALLLFGDLLKHHDYVGVDISSAVVEARKNFESEGVKAEFLQSDLASIPEELGTFDLIFSEGVLHHTDGVADSIASLCTRLAPGGRFAFYVYARKAPVREFTDDLVRHAISSLTDEEAWEALIPLTELGKSLGELAVTVDIPSDIGVLGISKGTYDLQRLFYYAFCKAYFRADYSLAEMNHINFDWYRPLNCHRHTSEEVTEMCEQAGLKVQRLHTEPSGITVIAVKEQ